MTKGRLTEILYSLGSRLVGSATREEREELLDLAGTNKEIREEFFPEEGVVQGAADIRPRDYFPGVWEFYDGFVAVLKRIFRR